MIGKKLLFGGIMVFAIAGCSSQPLVKTLIKDRSVEFRFQGDHNRELSDRLAKATAKFEYTHYYINAFNGSDLVQTQQIHNTRWDFADLAAAGFAGDIALKQMIGGGIGISGIALGISLLTPTDDAYIKSSVYANYQRAINGSVTITKLSAKNGQILTNEEIVEDLKRFVGDAERIVELACRGAMPYRRQVLWPDHAGNLLIRCKESRNSLSFTNWKIKESVVLDKIWHGGWGDTLILNRETLGLIGQDDHYEVLKNAMPSGYFMLWAAPGRNPQTGKEEKVFHVYKDGVEKVFPLPPPPKIS